MTINFLPWRERCTQRRKKHLLIEVFSILILIVLCSVVWQLSYHYVLDAREKQLNFLEKKIVAMSAYYADALNKRDLQAIEKQQEIFLKNQANINQTLLSVLDKLTGEMPNEVYLTSISKKENKLYLAGKSPSNAELAIFLRHIEEQIHREPVLTETTHAQDQSVEIDFEVGEI